MKVYPFSIPKPTGDRLIVQVDKARVFYDHLHQHDEIQISYLVKGEGKLIIGDSVHPYSKGDLFVIGKNCPHVFQSSQSGGGSHMISVFFTEDSFGPEFFKIPETEILQPFFEHSKTGFQILSNTAHLETAFTSLPGLDQFMRFLVFLDLLKTVVASDIKQLTGFERPKRIPKDQGNRIGVVFDYVMNNFQKEIDLESIAAMVFMTPPAFCRFFKRHTNKTFFQFLIALRIEHACQLLKASPQLPIAEISELSGFRSISNFNRMFKKLKACTPREYFDMQLAV